MNWITYAILAAFFASLVTVFSKIGLEQTDTHTATTIRAFVMFLFMGIFLITQKKLSLIGSLPSKEYFYIILAGLCGGLSWLFYFLALKLGSATKVASLDRLSILFVLIFSLLFLGEAFTWKTTLGVISIIIGSIFLVL
jgi:transporter family protein